MLGEAGMDGRSKHLRRVSRDDVAVVERELDAERFERLEQFAQRHRIIPRERVPGSLGATTEARYTRSAIRKSRCHQAGASRLLESAAQWRVRKILMRSLWGGKGARRAVPKAVRHVG